MDRREGAALVSAGVNVALVVVKVLLAGLSGSIALLADAWHSLSDVFVSLFVYAGFRFSGRSRKRIAIVENAVALVIGIAILGAGLSIFRRALGASPREVSNLGVAMAGTFLTIVVAHFLARYKLHVGTATKSVALVADGAHSRMDVYSSCAVLVGLLGQMVGLRMDKAAAVVVVLFIARAGFQVVGNALRALAAGELLDTTGALDVSGTWLGKVGGRLSGALGRVVGKPPRASVAGVRDFLSARRAVLLPAVLALAIAAYLLSGIYVVGPDQRAVVLRLGRAVAVDIGPGLRWAWPRPVDRIITYRRSYLRRLEVGFRLRHPGVTTSPGDAYLWESRHMGGFYEKRAEEALMLTGDENIIDLNLVVQYRIADPAAYLFRVSAPDTFVRAATEAVVRGVVSREPLEGLLTTDRRRIADEVVSGLQGLLDQYGAGVDVVSVRLQDVHPPVEVVTAFREVSSAREDKSRLMREAEAYGADALPRARGEAYQALQAAQQTLVWATNRATGEADRFASVVQEYRRARDVRGTRLYLGTVDQTLAGARKVVVDASIPPGEVDLRLLPPGIKGEDIPAIGVPSSQTDLERQLEQMGMGGFLGSDAQQQPLGVPGDLRGR